MHTERRTHEDMHNACQQAAACFWPKIPCRLYSWPVEGLNCKRPIPICRLFFKIDLLTDIAALCLTDFIEWRYIHSLVGIFDPACELLPPWKRGTILVYFCPSIFSPTSSPPSPPSPTKCTVYTDSVCLGGGGWIVLCRPYSAEILLPVSDQMQNLPNDFTTPNKMTSENDIEGLVSLKFLRPWAGPCRTLSNFGRWVRLCTRVVLVVKDYYSAYPVICSCWNLKQ
jgi:hypothetical protein